MKIKRIKDKIKMLNNELAILEQKELNKLSRYTQLKKCREIWLVLTTFDIFSLDVELGIDIRYIDICGYLEGVDEHTRATVLIEEVEGVIRDSVDKNDDRILFNFLRSRKG